MHTIPIITVFHDEKSINISVENNSNSSLVLEEIV